MTNFNLVRFEWSLYELLTHMINEVADFLRVGGARPVLRSRHEVWHHVVPEHLGPVVQTTVENTQIIVLVEIMSRLKKEAVFLFEPKYFYLLFVSSGNILYGYFVFCLFVSGHLSTQL